MSGYPYYPGSQQTTPDDDDFDFEQPFQTRSQSSPTVPQSYQGFVGQPMVPTMPQGGMYNAAHPFYQQPQQFQQQQYVQPQQFQGYQSAQQYQAPINYQAPPMPPFTGPTVPSNYPCQSQAVMPFPQYSAAATRTPRMTAAEPSGVAAGYLSPDEAGRNRASRSTSFASNRSSARSYSHSDVSTRSVSPSLNEMQRWGYQNSNGTWSCSYPGCSSKSSFSRGCDLRKHYKRHTKSLFCRVDGCPQAMEGGFSSKKDRVRHEAKHNPNIVCEWEGCDRLFSRTDNMKDHVRRVHRRQAQR